MNTLFKCLFFCLAILYTMESVAARPLVVDVNVLRSSLTDSIITREIRIRVNKGRSLTNKRKVLVELALIKLNSKLIGGMRVGFSPTFEDTDWEPFKSTMVKEYKGSEGVIKVYAQMKDIAGNLSNIASDSTTLDETPPSKGEVIINKGAELSSNGGMRVRLLIKNSDAYKMQISNDSNFKTGTWEDYVPNKTWIMSPTGEGEKIVYVRFADKAANISEYCSDTIRFDLTPPQGTIIINNGDKFTNSRLAILKIKASEDTTIARIIGSGNVENIPYQEDPNEKAMIKDWYLDSAQGNKIIKVLFRDNAGNISSSVAYDDIILDTEVPKISYFKINRGKKYTIDKKGVVTLYIGTESLDVDFEMYISNDSLFTDTKPKKFTRIYRDWVIDHDVDGLKSVYLKFIDKAGNESEIRKASIILDTEAPIVKSFNINNDAKFTRNKSVKLYSEVEGVLASQFSSEPKFLGSNWEKYNPVRNSWVLPFKDGEKTVYAKFRDRAGNESKIVSDTIIKDSEPPSGKAIINDGKPFTNNKDGKVDIKFILSKEAMAMQYDTQPNFTSKEWKPIVSELHDFEFGGEDGEKRIFVRLKDSAENISETFTARVILDRKPPEDVSISINSDSLFVDRLDKLVLVSFQAKSAKYMMYAFDSTFKDSSWIKFENSKTINLLGEDGKKTIYAKFKDQIGNVSETVSDDIILDRYPPKPISFDINNGAEWTNDQNKVVTLNIKAEEAKDMIISLNPNFERSKWIPYKEKVENYVLEGEDGFKTIFIAFRDQYGHISKSLSARIRLKREF